ncbi:MAG: inactive transglutaminase family protein [Proteobacteria bacterium]|nr:inactive transglutaminase family protein [Pseudomonadota bacterium]
MTKRITFYAMVVMIATIGFLVAALRHFETGIPLFPGQERSVWLVEARIDFRATGDAVTVSFSLPEQLPGFDLYQEQAASPGYGFSIVTENGDRRGEWTKREAQGEQSLYYTAQFAEVAESVHHAEGPTPRAVSVYWDDAQNTAAQQLLTRASTTSSSPHSLARELIKLLNQSVPDQNTALLLAGGEGRAELLSKLLNQAGVPARIVMGLHLEDARRRQQLVPMIEIHAEEKWTVFNPKTGEPGVPSDLLLWHRGGKSLLDVTGGRRSRVSFSIVRQQVPALQLARAQNSDNIFSSIGIHRLPVEEQSMFKLLFLLPLGAVVVVFMRVLVGLQTAGTFMPILIALAFLQTSLLPGLISFVSVVGIGLLLRSYLSRLNLLLVARIATLLVLVIFIISAMSVIGYQMGYSTGMTITFFPMIIIAWTIERMSILWEEEGPHEVLIQGGGSLFVAVIAYLLMDMPLLGHLTFNFPEVNLILLAAILGMGQYTGYKLSELHRFRAMDEG